jgi:hypothetical protein
MLRDEESQGDEDCQYEEQYGASDATAPWRKIPRVVGARHLQSKNTSERRSFTPLRSPLRV